MLSFASLSLVLETSITTSGASANVARPQGLRAGCYAPSEVQGRVLSSLT